MRINWKVRRKNPQFWLQTALAVAVPIGAYYGITGADITSWSALGGVLADALRNPYVLFTIGVSVYNAIPDPTVAGLSDSTQAMTYSEPKKDGKEGGN